MPGPLITRRRFLQTLAGAAAVGMGLPAYATQVAPFWVRVVDRAMPIAGLPAEWDGKTLLHLSDLHAGPARPGQYLDGVDPQCLARALDYAKTLRPDLIAITGDLGDDVTDAHLDQVNRLLARLAPGPHQPAPVLAILGNHDYGDHWARTDRADRLTARLHGLGLTVLRNQAIDLDGLQIVGLDDMWSPNYAPSPPLAAADRDRPTIVLTHNPDSADDPAWPADLPGWILAGHTHGGQCRIPFCRPPILPVRNKRYTAGIFPLAGGRTLHINPGLGYTRQARFAVPPEITRFRLRSV